MNGPLRSLAMAGVGVAASCFDVVRPHPPRLEADRPGGANQVINLGVAPDQRQLALEMGGIGGDPVVGRDAAECPQAGVGPEGLHQRGGVVHRSRAVSGAAVD